MCVLFVTNGIHTVVYIFRFPVDSSQILKGAAYFSPGCQMTLSPIVPWHPPPCWPFYQRHPVIIAKRKKRPHLRWMFLICTFGCLVKQSDYHLLGNNIIHISQNFKKMCTVHAVDKDVSLEFVYFWSSVSIASKSIVVFLILDWNQLATEANTWSIFKCKWHLSLFNEPPL